MLLMAMAYPKKKFLERGIKLGLSDEERVKGLYFAIDKIVELGRWLDDHLNRYERKDYKYLLGFINDLWHALVCKQSHSSLWVLGSSAVNTVRYDTLTPWGIGISSQCREGGNTDDNTSNAFEDFLDIKPLLTYCDNKFGYIYEIYQWVEQAIYYLRRYEDELSNSLSTLDKCISNIYGECFSLFKDNQAYAHAYILHNVLKIMYADGYPYKKDAFSKYLDEGHIHHKLSHLMRHQNLKLISDMYKKMYRDKKDGKLTLMVRVEAMFKLCGSEYHYDHQFDKLVKILPKKEVFNARGWFGECKKLHDEQEKFQGKIEKLSDLSIFGPTEE
jgi:hypothetical protein